MNNVIIIHELDHNDIGVAADYKSAIYYLIKERWIDNYTDVIDDNDNIVSISKALGENWKTVLLNADEDWFNDKFVDQFGLEHIEIYKHE